jgi:hypothetical protein
MTHRLAPLALALVLPLAGCVGGGGSEPVPCSPEIAPASGWLASGVLDPRDPPNGMRPQRIYELLIEVTPDAGQGWSVHVLDVDPVDPSPDPMESGPFEERGTGACESSADSFVASLTSNVEPHDESLHARLLGGHLLGRLTIGGLETSFDAVPR